MLSPSFHALKHCFSALNSNFRLHLLKCKFLSGMRRLRWPTLVWRAKKLGLNMAKPDDFNGCLEPRIFRVFVFFVLFAKKTQLRGVVGKVVHAWRHFGCKVSVTATHESPKLENLESHPGSMTADYRIGIVRTWWTGWCWPVQVSAAPWLAIPSLEHPDSNQWLFVSHCLQDAVWASNANESSVDILYPWSML